MGSKTPLYQTHVAAGARMVDFGGWDMPVNYGSQIEEHHAVRRDAGMFDVSHMLIARGGVVDDLITYRVDDRWFRVVVNAGTREKDTNWLKRWAAPFQVDVQPRTDLAMIAVQGPNARAKAAQLLGERATAALDMKPFFGRELAPCFVARTGYTGEDGWEIMLPAGDAPKF